MPARDPYNVLEVSSSASDEEVRAAYRRLVRLHHPDHNRGSAESARRFEEVQDAYARIKELRSHAPAEEPRPNAPTDQDLEARLAKMERDLREAHLARERARQAAREAAAKSFPRPSDEELGYVKTDDSFSKILHDAREELSDRFTEATEHPTAKRVGDLIDELAAKFTGESPPRPRR